MSENKLKFTIRSRKNDGDRLRLDDFAEELSHIYKILVRMDKLVSRKRQPTMFFQITNLEYSSPATVEVAAIPEEPSIDYTKAVGVKFIKGIGDIQRGEIPEDFDDSLVNDFRKLGSSINKEVASIDVAFDNERVNISRHLDEFIGDVLGGDYFAEGSITGMLEQINIHGGKNEFRVYPVAGPVSIKCKFSDDVKGDAVKSLDRHITIYGRLGYRPRAKFPHCAEVNRIEIHPPDNKLPSFADLRGVAPDATGDLSSEDFIRRLRDAD
ncbi:MAG: hypothetical protein V3V99_12670 [candidate division Zixibacteria bacterium]